MKNACILWVIFLITFPFLAKAEQILPYRPTSRVSDLDGILDPEIRDLLSQTLKQEYDKNKISTYLVAMTDAGKGQEAATAKTLRDAWIKDPVGLIVLYSRKTDEISISLTPAAYRQMASAGNLEILKKKIDAFNEEGPSRGMPKVINLLLDRLRVDSKPVVVIQKRNLPLGLLLVPFCIFFAAGGWGLFKLFRYMVSQNIFTQSYVLKSNPIMPVLGSTIGGVNTAEAKY